VPDVVGSVETLDEEGLVLDDRRNGVVAVAKAHVVVVHGEGAAAGAVLVGVVHALVWFGWLALEVFVGLVHGGPPPGYGSVMSLKKLWLRMASDEVVNTQLVILRSENVSG
jgi:hypothetical protein